MMAALSSPIVAGLLGGMLGSVIGFLLAFIIGSAYNDGVEQGERRRRPYHNSR